MTRSEVPGKSPGFSTALTLTPISSFNSRSTCSRVCSFKAGSSWTLFIRSLSFSVLNVLLPCTKILLTLPSEITISTVASFTSWLGTNTRAKKYPSAAYTAVTSSAMAFKRLIVTSLPSPKSISVTNFSLLITLLPVSFIFLIKNVASATGSFFGKGLFSFVICGALGSGGSSWGRD